jgi:hypothetical protein
VSVGGDAFTRSRLLSFYGAFYQRQWAPTEAFFNLTPYFLFQLDTSFLAFRFFGNIEARQHENADR